LGKVTDKGPPTLIVGQIQQKNEREEAAEMKIKWRTLYVWQRKGSGTTRGLIREANLKLIEQKSLT
jgi:hypothetical protein